MAGDPQKWPLALMCSQWRVVSISAPWVSGVGYQVSGVGGKLPAASFWWKRSDLSEGIRIGCGQASAPALKRVSYRASFPPHECGGFHQRVLARSLLPA